jgi:hypothetical protein
MNGFIDILLSNVILATKYIYYIYNFIYVDFFNLTAFEDFLSRERKLEKYIQYGYKSWSFNELH